MTDIFRCYALDDLLMKSDAITLHCLLTDETRHIINEQTLKQCRPGVFIINTSRGGLIDEVRTSWGPILHHPAEF